MGKLISLLSVLLINIGLFAAGHVYFSNNPKQVLIVVESAYNLKRYENDMRDWIEDYQSTARYQKLLFGTSNVYLGEGDANVDRLFKVSFGKTLDEATLQSTYTNKDYDERYLLTFTDAKPQGWNLVSFK